MGDVGSNFSVSHPSVGNGVNGSVSALEELSAGSLFDYLAFTGRFSPDLARHYFAQLCAGLDSLHK